MIVKKKKIIKYCVVGISDHQGVFHVGGRLGAQRGPAFFRRHFSKMRSQRAVWENFSDQGDVQGISGNVEANIELASQAVQKAHRAFDKVIVIGGGHDHGFSQLNGLRGAVGRKARIGCINLDAHLDVRKPSPHVTSGSPFYLALERGVIRGEDFIEFGIQQHANSPELFSYVEEKGVKVIEMADLRFGKAVKIFQKELTLLSKRCDQIALSVDLDAFAAAYAPGVSAPQAEGFAPSEVLQMLEFAAKFKKVRSLGIFELCPEHDVGGATALLAATLGFHFLEYAE